MCHTGSNVRKGNALIIVTLIMGVLFLFVSLAVDLGRVQVIKMELHNAADAAARSGAVGLETSSAQAITNAVTVAGQNLADGNSVVIPNSDVEVGNWANGTFTLNGTPANAVRVHANRCAAEGNAVSLNFARLFGIPTCDVHTTAVATCSPNQPGGFIGYSSVTMMNNTFAAGYNPNVTTSPSQSNYQSTGEMGSNGTVSGGNNNSMNGTVFLGPTGSVSGMSVNGSTTTVTNSITVATSPAWSPGTNPGNIPQNYTVGSDTTLPGGTYWFTSLTISATLQFSGPTTIYVNGNVDLTGTLEPTSLVPTDLMIYQIGSYTFGDANANGMTLIACVTAPNSSFVAKNNLVYEGFGLFNTITVKNNAALYYDSGSAPGGAYNIVLCN